MVAQGGSKKTMSGISIVKLGKLGMRAEGLYPTVLKKYAVFGAEVLSPCDGVVAEVVENLPDNAPGERDAVRAAGNYVSIVTDGATVVLAHLMNKSVTVDAGQRVRVGQILGRVGNSGDAAEPQLGIHVERDGRGIPMRFNERFLAKNDCVDA